jgi:hypothetical protein
MRSKLPMHLTPRCGARTRSGNFVPSAGDAERPMSDARRTIRRLAPLAPPAQPVGLRGVGRGYEVAARPAPAASGLFRRASADVSDALLGCFLGWRFWLCRKLKHCCLLTLA